MKNLTRALAALMLWCACASAASTVLISDTLKVAPENGLFYGTITITAPQMSRAGVPYVRWVRTYRVEAGAVSITLVPNAGSTPLNTRYKVDYAPDSNARPWSTWWVVPDSAISLKVQDVELPDTSAPAVIPLLNVSQINPSGATATYCIQYSGTAVTWGPCGSSVWGGLSGTLSNQTDLQVALNAKAAVAHTHIVGDVTGLQAALDGKSATTHTHATLYAALAHVHLVADVSGLQAALDGKSATTHNHTGTYEPIDATILRSGGSYANPAWLIIDKTKVGLGNVDNTTDLSKPVSTAVQTALNLKADSANPSLTGVFDIGGLTRTRPWKYGITAPATCTLGDAFFDTDATAGENILICTATDTWTPIKGGGASTPLYSLTFAAQTTVTLAHNAGVARGLVQCADASGNAVYPMSINTDNTIQAVVTFGQAQSGTCSHSASSGGSGGTSGISSVTVSSSGAGVKILKDSTGATVVGKSIIAGTNVTLTEGADTVTIASSGVGGGTTYTAGTGISITGTVISINGPVVGTTLCGTATPTGWTSITAGGYQDQSVTISGFIEGDALALGAPSTLASALEPSVMVTGADTLRIRLKNLSAGSLTPANLTYKICTTRLF